MIKTGEGIEKASFQMLHSTSHADYLPPQFVNDLEAKFYPAGIKDREILLALKKREHEEKGFSFDGEFYLWDLPYYDRKYIEETLRLDDILVKEYFPVSTVVPAILEIYQNLLGVQFELIQNASTWHPGMFISFSFTLKPYLSILSSYAKMSKGFLFGRKMPKMPLVSLDIATWICSLAVCNFLLLTLSIQLRTE